MGRAPKARQYRPGWQWTGAPDGLPQFEAHVCAARRPEWEDPRVSFDAVEGYEMLCFGPGDFSQRIGKPGDMSAPEIADARKKVAAAAKKHGKVMMAPGMMAPKEVLDAEGFMFYGLGADVISLSSFFKGEVENFFGKDATTAAKQYDVAK